MDDPHLANKEFKRPFSSAINLALSRRRVNRHPRHELFAKNSAFAGLFKPFLSLRGPISPRFRRLPERKPIAIAGSVAEPVWVDGSSRLEQMARGQPLDSQRRGAWRGAS